MIYCDAKKTWNLNSGQKIKSTHGSTHDLPLQLDKHTFVELLRRGRTSSHYTHRWPQGQPPPLLFSPLAKKSARRARTGGWPLEAEWGLDAVGLTISMTLNAFSLPKVTFNVCLNFYLWDDDESAICTQSMAHSRQDLPYFFSPDAKKEAQTSRLPWRPSEANPIDR